MKTLKYNKLLASSAILVALTACTEIVPTSRNGLPFADGTPFERADRASPEGTTFTLRAVKIDMTGNGPYIPDEGTDFTSATTKLVDVTVVETWSGVEIEDAVMTVDIDGDSITFTSTDFDDGLPVTSDLGDVYYFTVHEGIEGSVFILNGYTDETVDEWQNIEFYTVIGLETDPGFLEGKAEATYEGMNYLWLIGDLEGDYDCSTCYARGYGEIEITADFDAATIEGGMTGILDATFAGIIENNGWTAGFVAATGFYSVGDGIPDFGVISADGQLEGVFYGVDGEHTAGLITTDFIVDGDPDWGLSGGGYFVACEDPVACGLVDP